MQDYRKLTVWGHAHGLALHVHRETGRWNGRAAQALASQLRRSAISIAANIAEGAHRRTSAEFGRHLDIAYASAGETDYHLLLARDLGLVSERAYEELSAKAVQVKRMLHGLSRRVRHADVAPDVAPDAGRPS